MGKKKAGLEKNYERAPDRTVRDVVLQKAQARYKGPTKKLGLFHPVSRIERNLAPHNQANVGIKPDVPIGIAAIADALLEHLFDKAVASAKTIHERVKQDAMEQRDELIEGCMEAEGCTRDEAIAKVDEDIQTTLTDEYPPDKITPDTIFGAIAELCKQDLFRGRVDPDQFYEASRSSRHYLKLYKLLTVKEANAVLNKKKQ